MKNKTKVKRILEKLTAKTLEGAAGNYIEPEIHDKYAAKIMELFNPKCIKHYNPYCKNCIDN